MEEIEWVSDENGNKCSVQYFGSQEAAQKALDSLKNCKNCINCSGCSRCSGCSYCSGCSRCSGCSDCSYCSRCSDCSGLKESKPTTGTAERPLVPKIENIHQKILAAVSVPKALNMKD